MPQAFLIPVRASVATTQSLTALFLPILLAGRFFSENMTGVSSLMEGVMSQSVIFFTGFPGFIGKRLVSKILESNASARFRFLVQSSMLSIAQESIAGFKKKFPQAEFSIMTGSIDRADLGLGKEALKNLVEEVTDVFHLAAIYDLSVPREIAYKVNVDGTTHILDFCEKIKALNKLVYFSTCYVAGKRTGRILEDDLEKGQQFKNYYEETKYLAEVEVRKRMKNIPAIVIRPSIVVGDSETGETQKFDGPYFMMRFIDMFYYGVNIPYIGDSTSYFNIVPVDYIINGSIALWKKQDNAGKTYQLADPHPVRARELFALLSEHLTGETPGWALPHWLIEGALSIPMVGPALGIPVQSLLYLKHPVEYDCRNAVADLEESGVSCPSVKDYIGNLVSFFKEHKEEEKYRVKVH